MKKGIFMALCLIFTALSLSACQVNWYGKQYHVSPWLIVVPVIIFTIAAWVAAGKHVTSQKYVCPKCNHSFYPRFWNAAISIHMNNDRVLKCPHCKRKGFCPPSRESDR